MGKLLLTLFVAVMAVTQLASAATYRATNWLPTVHILNSEPYQQFAKELAVATDGDINFTVYSSGSLVPAESTMQAIRDGVAALGIVYPPYTPAELPVNNVINDLGFVATDPMAAAFAYTEINLANERLIDEWRQNGGIFLGGYATPFYVFQCVNPIRALADAKGKKIRTAGGAQTDWATYIGGVPVSVPIADVYSGLTRGSIDCTMSDPTNLAEGAKLWEVVNSVTMLPMGVVFGATYVVNPSFWRGLQTDQRRTLLNYIAAGLARSQVTYAKNVKMALEGAKERGVDIFEPAADLKSELDKFKSNFVKELPKESIAKYSVDDPSALIAQFQKLEEKWHGLLENIDRNDPKAIAELLRKKIYDKVDVATYGLE